MNIYQSKVLYYPRQIGKQLFALIYPIYKLVFKFPQVQSIDDTISHIIANKSSICRYGDGEFLFITGRTGIPFQPFHEQLRNDMVNILVSNEPNILIGLPIGYQSLKNLKKNAQLTWKTSIVWMYPKLRKFLDLKKVYYNASMTRLYIDYDDKSQAGNRFKMIKQIWYQRDVLLIEGEKSRLGVGNDLFENMASLHRILTRAVNAYEIIDEITNEVMKYDKDTLILIALGPTATVLAFQLAKNHGYQSIDIGNIDIEYEWFLKQATQKIKIQGKYSNEAPGGRNVEDMHNEVYQSQIVARVL